MSFEYSYSESEKQPFLQINGNEIYFQEDWGTGIGGGLWSTGKALALFFRDHPDLLRKNLKAINENEKIRAIELGSGNGLLSVCLAAVAKDLISELVITDLDDHLDLIRKSVHENQHVVDSNLCKIVEHRWGEFDDMMGQKFDFIFGSDLAYWNLQEPLIQSLKYFSHKNTISLIGITMLDTKPSFFKMLQQNGFNYNRIPDHAMRGEFRGNTFGLFVIQNNPFY